jgi:hypothetical protein
MENEESKKAFDGLQKALGKGYVLQDKTVQLIELIKVADGEPIAYATYAVDDKGKRVQTITSTKGDGEYISEISKSQRKKIEKLGFKFLEQ